MKIEHLVLLTNEQGERAQTAMLRISTPNKAAAITLARRHGFKNFDVIERADSDAGYSDQCVHIERAGEAA